jgi:hypothetical protein
VTVAHDAFPPELAVSPSLFEDDITVDQLRPERAAATDDLARAIGADLAFDPVIDDVLGRAPSWSWWLTRTRK